MLEIMDSTDNLDNCLNQREVGIHSIWMIYYRNRKTISAFLETRN